MPTHPGRRGLLKGIGAVALVAPALSGRTRGASAQVRDTEAYWDLLRRQFIFRNDAVPMNAAGLCPSFRSVADHIEAVSQDVDTDPSPTNRNQYIQSLELSRSKVAQQLGVEPGELALVRNATEANSAINNGLDFQQGDQIVIWDQNHATNNQAWDVRARRYGLDIRRVSVPRQPESIEQVVAIFADACTDRTRLMSFSHVASESGLRLPARELCTMARDRGIFSHVDGAQSWGALDIDLHDMGCDSFAASAHRWFLGPKETGILFVRNDRAQEIWSNIIGYSGDHTFALDQPNAQRFETLGQRDDASLAAIGETVDLHDQIGSDTMEARVADLATALKDGLEGAGVRLATPAGPEWSAGIVLIEIPMENRLQAVETLYHDYGIAGANRGGLRLSPHIYNSMAHVDRAVDAVTAIRHLQ